MTILKCQNCGYTDEDTEFETVKQPEGRHIIGDVFSDKECARCGSLAFPVETEPKEITITLEGGMVRKVTLNGQEISATVHDHDTDGCDIEELHTDADGGSYMIFEAPC